MEELLTVEEVAKLLKLSPYHVRRLLKKGEIHGVKLGGIGQWRVKRSDVNAYLSSPAPARQKG